MFTVTTMAMFFMRKKVGPLAGLAQTKGRSYAARQKYAGIKRRSDGDFSNFR